MKPVAKRQLLPSGDGGQGLAPHSGRELDDLAGAEVFTELYRAQFHQLVRLSRIRTGDAPEAEDLVQDAFVAVRRAYPDKATDELRPLLFTTLRNLTLNYLKSGDTKRRQASVELLGSDDRLGCSRTVTPETQLMDAQLLTIAEQTIAAMVPRRREVLKLHRFEQLTYDEIGRRLSVSRSTVKKELADAIAEVAEALARKSGQGVDGLVDRK
tara:strand:- start:14839 stop:15474 length:636 start_codon:yes stop_codon:yes gene_type:complete